MNKLTAQELADQLDNPHVASVSSQTPSPEHRPSPFKIALFGLATLGLISLGLVFATSNGSQHDRNSTGIANSSKQPEIQIEITNDGFVPATVIVPKGAHVSWVNKDTNPHQVAANPFPSHAELPGLYTKTPIGPDSEYSYTFDKAGTVNYHDQLNPTVNGVIVVE